MTTLSDFQGYQLPYRVIKTARQLENLRVPRLQEVWSAYLESHMVCFAVPRVEDAGYHQGHSHSKASINSGLLRQEKLLTWSLKVCHFGLRLDCLDGQVNHSCLWRHKGSLLVHPSKFTDYRDKSPAAGLFQVLEIRQYLDQTAFKHSPSQTWVTLQMRKLQYSFSHYYLCIS